MGMGGPGKGTLHGRTKKFRIIFEWGGETFRGGMVQKAFPGQVPADHSSPLEGGVPL